MTMTATQSELTFGVEIEMAGASAPKINDACRVAGVAHRAMGYTHAVTAHWKTVSDASCGLELVSPILKGEPGLADLHRVGTALVAGGLQANRSCGFHVHIGAQTMTHKQLQNVMKAFVRDEDHFDSLLPDHRRTNNFARSNRASINSIQGLQTSELFAKIDAAGNRNKLIELFHGTARVSDVRGAGRYRKLNLLSLLQHGTIEFRQHSGTVDPKKMTTWVRLLTGFVDYAMNAPRINPEKRSWELFKATLPGSSARDFLDARREQFAAR